MRNSGAVQDVFADTTEDSWYMTLVVCPKPIVQGRSRSMFQRVQDAFT